MPGPRLTRVDVEQVTQQPWHRAGTDGERDTAAFEVQDLGVIHRGQPVPEPFGLAQQRGELVVAVGGQPPGLQRVDRGVRRSQRDRQVRLLQCFAHVFDFIGKQAV